METIIHRSLVDDTIVILKDTVADKLKNGFDMNVFTLLDREREEQHVHENMLHAILNFKSDKRIAERFVTCLFENMKMPKEFVKKKWQVEQQYYTSFGTMDMFLRTEGKHRKCVIVELKIDASDQKEQLERYWKYVKKSNYEDCRIIYLTLDGRAASEQSIGNVPKNKIYNISFKKHILKWLEQCLYICDEECIESSFIKQYRILINKMVGENNMSEKVRLLIKSSDDLRASIEIANSLPRIKADILYNFLYTINEEIEKKGYMNNRGYEEIEYAKDYYDGKAVVIEMDYIIKEYSISNNRNLQLVLGVGVNYSLYYYLGFLIDGDRVDSKEIMRTQKRKYQKIENEIINMLNIEIRENNYDSIYSDKITDVYGHKYDFKHFSDNCADLKEDKRLKSEAKRISRKMLEYIKCLSVALNDNNDMEL